MALSNRKISQTVLALALAVAGPTLPQRAAARSPTLLAGSATIDLPPLPDALRIDGYRILRPQSEAVAMHFADWRARYLKASPTANDELYVDSSGDAGRPGDITVSEAHGYGMLLLVGLADLNPHAQTDFDKMVRFMAGRQLSRSVPLMVWRIAADGRPGAGETSAPDGDIDIARALLQADAQWGSRGDIDYRALALAKIHALMDHVVQQRDGKRPVMGLWEDISVGDHYYGGTRPSDYIVSGFKAFAAATNDGRWLRLVDSGYVYLQQLTGEHGSSLVPDFAKVTRGHAQPVEGAYLEGDSDSTYGYNACRVPWRLTDDFATSQDARAQALLLQLSGRLMKAADNEPSALVDGYQLDGSKSGRNAQRLAFVAPVAAALHYTSSDDAVRSRFVAATVNTRANGQGYYNETIRLLVLTMVRNHPRLPLW